MDTRAFYSAAEWLRPAQDMWAVTPHDTAAQQPFRALWVGVAGNVAITTARGNDVVIPNVPAGWLDISGLRVKATGTTASSILGAE